MANLNINRVFTQSLTSTSAPAAGQHYKARPASPEDLFTFRLSGTWVGTADLQVSDPDAETWITIDQFTANTKEAVAPINPGDYRIKLSAYTSGTVLVRFTRK